MNSIASLFQPFAPWRADEPVGSPWMPAEAPLAMPRQGRGRGEPVEVAPAPATSPRNIALRRAVLFGGALLLTALLRWDMGDGPNWLTVTAMVGARGWDLPPFLDFSEPGGLIYNALLHVRLAAAWIATLVVLMRAPPAEPDGGISSDEPPRIAPPPSDEKRAGDGV